MNFWSESFIVFYSSTWFSQRSLASVTSLISFHILHDVSYYIPNDDDENFFVRSFLASFFWQ
jgi:hypothetical protein